MYQSKMLSLKEKKMITFFRHSKLPKYKVHLAYHSMYTKSLQFPLGVTMMAYDMANNISKRTTQAVILARMKLLGLGLRHRYFVQGITHCKHIIQHLQQQDKNSKMYMMIFE
jgi:hypothetical protein